jgi:lipopolysaccharide/colanic/teichoic acid biosynthesis glycosyltransferase
MFEEVKPPFGERRTMSALNPALNPVASQSGPRKLEVRAHLSVPLMRNVPARIILNEDAFVSMLYLERRRTERTQKRLVLVLVDVSAVMVEGQHDRSVQKIAAGISKITRETDVIGWHVQKNVIGIIGTELGEAAQEVIQERFLEKMRGVFEEGFGKEQGATVSVSFHFYPEDPSGEDNDHSANIALYPEMRQRKATRRFALALKRLIDIAGSAGALFVLAPIFATIAIVIKLTSKGPVLFKQERLGQCGRKFKVLKFRSMYTNCDSKIHEAYVNQFIAGADESDLGTDGAKPVFKIQKDPRITDIGHFLRKTSLDELPQFWNVLIGDMSLVGPRPPVAYEYRAYNMWHRRRVLEIKPGITGLWQVEGRSRTRFDDMVRLDLKYARGWSIWLDLKILAQTPGAVFTGEGAH